MDSTYQLDGAFKPTIKRFADVNGPDFFPTPSWATRALMENEPFDGDVLEPACGDGSMARVIEGYGHQVIATDLYERGFGESGKDFLLEARKFSNVITNPPYNSAEGFLRSGLEVAQKKLALLLRLAFLEGVNRYKTVFSQNPPQRVWVFTERITFYPSGVERRGSGTTAYAWFVWDKNGSGSELCWLPPVYKNQPMTAPEEMNPMLFK